MVVQAAGCNALIPADKIDDVVFWEQGADRSRSKSCIGVVSYCDYPLQLFSLTEHMRAPKWHLSAVTAHWIVVVRANGQRLGLVVEGLIGWGAVAQRKASTREAGAVSNAFSVRLTEEATVDAEFVEVASILKTETSGQYFYI